MPPGRKNAETPLYDHRSLFWMSAIGRVRRWFERRRRCLSHPCCALRLSTGVGINDSALQRRPALGEQVESR